MLACLGFSGSARRWLVLMENATLLVSGLLLGSGCALVGIFPVLRQSANDLNVGSLAMALGGACCWGWCHRRWPSR